MARTAKRDLTRQQQLARGPVDLPYLGLVLILLGIGLVMLLSSSSYVASIEKTSNYDGAYYFKRQAAFAAMGGLIAPGTDAGAWAVPHGSLSEYALLEQALGESAENILSRGAAEIQRKF